MQPSFRYQAYYCEENIWHLAQDPILHPIDKKHVLFISNPTRSCIVGLQRAGAPKAYVVWDYHVILVGKKEGTWWIWDLDTLLSCPCPAYEYLTRTFTNAETWPTEYQPLFRSIEAQEYVRELSTNREHMLNTQGDYHAPQPPWKAPYAPDRGSNLMQFVDMTSHWIGTIYTRLELLQQLQSCS